MNTMRCQCWRKSKVLLSSKIFRAGRNFLAIMDPERNMTEKENSRIYRSKRRKRPYCRSNGQPQNYMKIAIRNHILASRRFCPEKECRARYLSERRHEWNYSDSKHGPRILVGEKEVARRRWWMKPVHHNNLLVLERWKSRLQWTKRIWY